MRPPSTDALRAGGLLHCNLNVRSLDVAAPVYEDGLGLRVRMKSRADGQDSSLLGLHRLTDSEAWFLYDHRGGRVAPAVELVEWTDPVTAGDAYSDPSEVGMQALGFEVPSLADTVARLLSLGSEERAGGEQGVGATMLDADGVALELTEGSVDAATLRYARLVCADLGVTEAWWSRLGFARAGDERTIGPEASERRLRLPGVPEFELRLTGFHANKGTGRAHDDANHRGLFRMALSVPDVRAAVAAARAVGAVGAIDACDPTYIPLPGTPLGGLWVSAFRDPDGVLVEFVER